MDAGLPDAGDAGTDAGVPDDRIVVRATEGTLSLPFTLTVDGSGTERIGDVLLDEGVGDVGIDGTPIAAAVHERQPWPGFDWILFQTLVVREDAIFVLWLYCRDGALEWIYYEGTDGTPMTVEAASGTCVDTPDPVDAAVSFPAVDMPFPPLVGGFTIEGADVSLASAAPGEVRLGATAFTLLVWSTVDCTVECGVPGWWELHALMWDRAGRACFGIYYLFDAEPTIHLTYSLSLPDLGDPAGDLDLEATWSLE